MNSYNILRRRQLARLAKIKIELSPPAVESGRFDMADFLESIIADLRADMVLAEPKSREGVAGALLRAAEFKAKIDPPTLEGIIDQLLSHPDFRLDTVAILIRDRYTQQQE